MPIERILSALENYLTIKNHGEIIAGDLNKCKKEFASALNDFIDFRFDGVLEQRLKRTTSQVDISIPELNTMTEKNKAISQIILLFDTLNSAPIPPINLADKSWTETYTVWYNTKRIAAMQSLIEDMGKQFDVEGTDAE